ncbi:hypothetical protein VTG60DRAFT_6829 [Thermothelomyces hinnuleus]
MALPVTDRDGYPPSRPSHGPCYYPPKRRSVDMTVHDDYAPQSLHKRPRYAHHPQFADPVAFKAVDATLSFPPLYHPHPHYPHHPYPSPCARVLSPQAAGTAVAAPALERTASGHSIRPDITERCASTELLEDHEAAQRVRDHLAAFRRRNPDSKHERILRSIISPRPLPPRRRRHHYSHSHSCHRGRGQEEEEEGWREGDWGGGGGGRVGANDFECYCEEEEEVEEEEEAEYPLDNDALESIFSAANEIFFNGRLSQRVTWDWSHVSSARYDSRVIGTTALRRAAAHQRGFETLIVLSSPILRDPRYSRRLLISTFLHELIHCYLFICCGFRARGCGGHTQGFRDIAALMDDWIGDGARLYLRRVEADLDLFRIGGRAHRRHPRHQNGKSGGGNRGEDEEQGQQQQQQQQQEKKNADEKEEGVEGQERDYDGGREVGGVVKDQRDRWDNWDKWDAQTDGRFGVPSIVYPCSGMPADQEEYVTAAAAAAALPGPGVQGVAYFRGGCGALGPPGHPVAYVARGTSLSPSRPGTPAREAVYWGRVSSPSSTRPGTPVRETLLHHSRSSFPSPGPASPPPWETAHYADGPGTVTAMTTTATSANTAVWRRQARGAGRHLYVYTADEAPASYVYAHPTGRRP